MLELDDFWPEIGSKKFRALPLDVLETFRLRFGYEFYGGPGNLKWFNFWLISKFRYHFNENEPWI